MPSCGSCRKLAVQPVALAEAAGEANFHWVRNADAYSGLQPRPYPVAPDTALIPVPCTAVDTLLAGETRRWRFAKLDLQGGELPALRGAVTAIAAHRPVLVFQNARAAAASAYGYDAAAFFGFFAGLGYRVLDLFGRPFGRADWDRPDIPWYSIAVAAGSSAEVMVEDVLGPILQDAAHRATDPGIGDLEPWLAQQPTNVPDHPLAPLPGTWERRRPGADAGAGGDRARRHLGPRRFPRAAARRGAAAIESDLRYPYAALDELPTRSWRSRCCSTSTTRHGPNASAGEVWTFLQTGAANLLRESFRILRPGGSLVLTTPNVTSIESIGHLLRGRHAFNYPPHVREYAPADVVAMAEAAGFSCRRRRPSAPGTRRPISTAWLWPRGCARSAST